MKFISEQSKKINGGNGKKIRLPSISYNNSSYNNFSLSLKKLKQYKINKKIKT
jgi:hypothetical protein